jgi:hypothetical protein
LSIVDIANAYLNAISGPYGKPRPIRVAGAKEITAELMTRSIAMPNESKAGTETSPSESASSLTAEEN